jgi:hypothetical protein
MAWLVAFLLFRGGHEKLGAASLAPMVIKPELLIPVVALLAWKRRWCAVTVIGACALAMAAISLVLIGLGQTLHFPAFLIESMGRRDPTNHVAAFYGATGIPGALLGSAHPAAATLLAIPILVVTGWLLVVTWRPKWDVRSEIFPGQWLALTIATLLLDPHLYSQDMVILIPLVLVWAVGPTGLEPATAKRLVVGAWLVVQLQPYIPEFHVNAVGIAMLIALMTLAWQVELNAGRAAMSRRPLLRRASSHEVFT